jgi:hypothetical protein
MRVMSRVRGSVGRERPVVERGERTADRASGAVVRNVTVVRGWVSQPTCEGG